MYRDTLRLLIGRKLAEKYLEEKLEIYYRNKP